LLKCKITFLMPLLLRYFKAETECIHFSLSQSPFG
jgi:hypothetical protein